MGLFEIILSKPLNNSSLSILHRDNQTSDMEFW
jgi:hypothetical protein